MEERGGKEVGMAEMAEMAEMVERDQKAAREAKATAKVVVTKARVKGREWVAKDLEAKES